MPIFDAHFHVFDIAGGAVVSGSFQAYDQTYLLDALGQLGPGFYGVANIPPDIGDDEVLALAAAGVRAFRINLYRGGNLDEIKLAPCFAALAGRHLEVYLDGCDRPELAPRLRTAPRLVIDHLGMTRAGVPKALRAISDVNPAALLFVPTSPEPARSGRSSALTSSWCARRPGLARYTTMRSRSTRA